MAPNHRSVVTFLALALVAGLAGLAPAAHADGGAPTPARALATRGPLALSLAAEPGSSHWSLETGWPLFAGRRRVPASTRGEARGLQLEALAIASSDRGLHPRAVSGLAYTLLLDRQRGSTASWLGTSFGGAGLEDGPRPRLRLAAGVSRALPGLQVEAMVVSTSVVYRNDPRWTRTLHYQVPGADSIVGGRDTSITVPAEHSATSTLAQGALRWQRGRFAVETVGGLSVGERAVPRRWAQGLLRVQLSRRVLALASLGERPAASLAFDGAAQPRTMLGVQIAPWSTPQWEMARALHPVLVRWKTEGAGPGRAVIRVHCRDTRRVEIAGDFTDWRPVELMALHGGWWAIAVPAESGPHRVQVRLDGGPWMAPHGLPRAEPGPAGEAGTMLVP